MIEFAIEDLFSLALEFKPIIDVIPDSKEDEIKKKNMIKEARKSGKH